MIPSFRAGHQDAAGVANALAVRDALEELIDTDAAQHRTEADVEDLNEIIERMRAESTTGEAFLRENWVLHSRIAEITPNDLARTLYLNTMAQAVGLPSQADSATAGKTRSATSPRASRFTLSSWPRSQPGTWAGPHVRSRSTRPSHSVMTLAQPSIDEPTGGLGRG